MYEFTCLLFGLNIAPLIFTKLTKPVVSYLRKQNLLSVIYLDDLLLLGKTYEDFLHNITVTESLITELGFVINFEKSNMIPSQKCLYLGLIYNSLEMEMVELPVSKRDRVKQIVNLKLNQKITIRYFAEILRILVSCCPAVDYGFVYTKSCEREKYLALNSVNNDYNAKMKITKKILDDFKWWKAISSVPKGPIKTSTYDLEIFTDASLTGWGAFCEGRAHGNKKDYKKYLFINELELLAAFFKSPFKSVTTQTLSRWVKEVLNNSGIDTRIFTAHSTRHASTSAAKRNGVDIDPLRRTAGWTKISNTFTKFYDLRLSIETDAIAKPVHNPKSKK